MKPKWLVYRMNFCRSSGWDIFEMRPTESFTKMEQARSHYLNQRWLDDRRIYASLGLNELREKYCNAGMETSNYLVLLSGATLLTRFNFNPSNYIHHKPWDEISHPLPNFNGCTVVWERISNFNPRFTEQVISYTCWYQTETMFVHLAEQIPPVSGSRRILHSIQ